MTQSSRRIRVWKAESERRGCVHSSSRLRGVERRKGGLLELQSATNRLKNQSGRRMRTLGAQTQRRMSYATTVAPKGTSPAIVTSPGATGAAGAVVGEAAAVAAEGEVVVDPPRDAPLVETRAPSAGAIIKHSSAISSQSPASNAEVEPATPTPSAQTESLGPSTRWNSGT